MKSVPSTRVLAVIDSILATHRPGRYQREGLLDLFRTLRTCPVGESPNGESLQAIALEHLSKVAPEIDPEDVLPEYHN
jgi:hypothetical protein